MAVVRRVLTFSALSVFAILLFCSGWLVGRTGIGSVVEPSSMTAAERQFADRMKNVGLIGWFTIDGREAKSSEPDRYDVASVNKVGDDLWQFNAKMDCCGVGGSGVIPIVVPMRFTGDTPTIVMTDTSLSGLGTFTVRLLSSMATVMAAPGSTASTAATCGAASRSRRRHSSSPERS